MKKTTILILTYIILFFVPACKKKDDCKAGLGGSLTLVTKMIHHTRPINGCKVYVKFNATEFPGEDVSKYDLSYTASNDLPELSIGGLNCGNYYIYAVGIDSLLDPVNWVVKGGVPYSTDQKEGTYNLNVYVTEGD